MTPLFDKDGIVPVLLWTVLIGVVEWSDPAATTWGTWGFWAVFAVYLLLNAPYKMRYTGVWLFAAMIYAPFDAELRDPPWLFWLFEVAGCLWFAWVIPDWL